MMFPCVDLDFSQIPVLLEVEQHATVLHVTGYYHHIPMLAKGKKRVFARPCGHKEPRTVPQERGVRFCSYLRGMKCFITNTHMETF